MATTRRDFIALTLGSYAALSLGHGKARARTADAKKLKILILGGTGFLGPHTVEAALARGHEVTIFNRGKTEKRRKEIGAELDFMDKVEILYGNRDPNLHSDEKDDTSPKGLEALKDRKWDAVIDNSGYYPRMVKSSAEMLAPNIKYYIFISSISAYADNSKPGSDETAAVATMPDPTLENMGEQMQYYGSLKALCEQAAEAAMPGKTANVRPGYIVGPFDPTPRFTYWPVRLSQAKGDRAEVLVPGKPEDPVQIIDARDLGAWLVTLCENNTTGYFNAVGPENKLTAAEMLAACKTAAGTDATFTYVDPEFIQVHNPQGAPWPILIPPLGDHAGFHQWSNKKAVAAGLKFRPVVDTSKDTLAWFNSMSDERKERLYAGFPLVTKEGEILAKYRDAVKERDAKG